MYECNCTKKDFDKFDKLQLNIGGKEFSMPVESWASFDGNEEKPCKLLMHPYDISMTATYKWVVGVQFMQQLYSIFDIQNKKVGLVLAKD